MSLGRALDRLRTADPARSADPEKPRAGSTEPLSVKQVAAPEPAPAAVPVPPDAPQPKGQLLDFIDALKKRRAGLAEKLAEKKAQHAPNVSPKKATAAPPPKQAPAEPPSEPRKPATAKSTAAEPASIKRPPPKVLARRSPPRPRRVRKLGMPSRRWRSLLYRLAIGLGIAGIAVAYQDKLPHIEGRGASVVSSQATDLSPTTRMTGHRGAVTGLATGDQGRWIVSVGADGTLRVWNTGSGMLMRTIELDEGPATAIAVDDRRALTGHKGGAVVLWDLERAEKLGLFQHQQAPIAALAFTGDPDHFAAAAQSGAVTLFDLRAPSAPVAAFEGQDGAQTIAASRWSGLLASAGQDRSIRLWRTDTRSLARSWRGQGDALSALDVAPGGRSVASGSTSGSVRLWSTSSSRPQRSFKAHEGRVTSVAFAPSDRLLASAGEDGQVKLWDLRSGRPPRVFRGHVGPVHSVAFSADGRRIMSAGQDGVIRLWNAAPTVQAQQTRD